MSQLWSPEHPRRPRGRVPARRWSRTATTAVVVGLLASGLGAAVAPTTQAATLDVRGDSDVVQASVVSVTSNYANASSTSEHADSLLDRDPSTKWYASGSGAPSASAPLYVIYTLSTAEAVTGYGITASSDSAKYPERDPKDWTVLGSNSASAATNATDASWQTLDTRASQAFAVSSLGKVYALQSSASYKYYQLRITANQGGSSKNANTQIADWTLRGEAPVYGPELITSSTPWSYLDDPSGTVDPAGGLGSRTAWTLVGATPAGTWTTASGPFGAKRGATTPQNGFPVTTTLPMDRGGTTDNVVPAYFFRTSFTLDQAGLDAIGGLYGTIQVDDTATVYLNGVAVASYDASGITSNLAYGGRSVGDPSTFSFLLPATGLQPGQNVVAVEVHNTSASSSDIYFAMPSLRTTVASAAHASRVVTSSTAWQYLDDPTGTIDPAGGAADRTVWTQVGATLPGTWTTGTGPFGAKRGASNLGSSYPVTTTLPLDRGGTSNNVVPAYFFRTTFEFDQAGLDSIKGLYGTLVHDDAATVYLNGVAVTTYDEGSTITANLSYAGGELGDPRTETFLVGADALRAGQNVLSVEVHNVNATSSDIYFWMPSLVAMRDTVVPAPFGSDVTGAAYSSDTVPAGEDGGEYFTDILNGYPDLRANHPDVLASNGVLPGGQPLVAVNDKLIVAINNGAAGAGQAQVDKRDQASHDADSCCSTYNSTTDGLGSVLGPLLYEALTKGQLPKTKWLLDNVGKNRDDHDGAAKSFYANERPPSRLGFTDGTTCANGLFTGPGAGRIARNYKPDTPSAYDGWCNNGSYPSGHTFSGYLQGTTMATLLPELAPELLSRASEYADNRTVLGAHYPLDLMGGRMIGQVTVANRWEDPAYRSLMAQATSELRSTLGSLCVEAGQSADIVQCARAGEPATVVADARQTYTDRLTYSAYTTADGVRHTDGFATVYPDLVDKPLIVPEGAADLLRSSFPNLTDVQRTMVVQATALPGGYALDKTRVREPSWERVNLLAAMRATVQVAPSGALVVDGEDLGDGSRYDDATASSLSVGGVPLDAFSPATTTYDVQLPVGVGTAPAIAAVATGSHAVVEVTQASGVPGTASVTVTAQDGRTVRTYTVSFTATPPSSDATLSSLKVGNTPVAGFSPTTTSYDLTLPAGTATAPVVTATAAEAHATVVVAQATTLPGVALVTVTAQDGTTVQSYSVNFTVGTSGGGKVDATVKASTKTTTYNKAAKVTVTVTAPGTTALGTVRVSEGSKLLGSGVLVAGKVTVTLPTSLGAGKHALSVTYVPVSSNIVAPAASRVSLTVKKASAKVAKVTVTKGKKGKNKVAKGKKATLKVQIRGVGAAAPTGKVTVKVGSKSFGVAKVKKSGKKYVAVVKTKALKKKGTIKVVYSGSKNLAKKTYTTKVKVK